MSFQKNPPWQKGQPNQGFMQPQLNIHQQIAGFQNQQTLFNQQQTLLQQHTQQQQSLLQLHSQIPVRIK